jgi:tungstate transport system substrate-binding protein
VLGPLLGYRPQRAGKSAPLLLPTLLLTLAVSICDRGSALYLVLATTTSVGNSGLLEELLTAFEREHEVRVRPHLVGSGLALKMLEKGDTDAVISHAPTAETSALRSHPTWRYRKIMFNEFVVVGPANDPAAAPIGALPATDRAAVHSRLI